MGVLLFSLIFLFVDITAADVEPDNTSTDIDVFNAVFPHIDNKQNGAKEHFEFNYWVAQVKPKNLDVVMCTARATFRDYNFFVTASRCLVTLRAPFTIVVDGGKELQVKAFVRTRATTKQLYGDIAYIVTIPLNSGSTSYGAPLPIPQESQTENDPAPFSYDFYLVLGFVSEPDAKTGKMTHTLYELRVKVGTDLCAKLINEDYRVPCYSYCTVLEYSHNKRHCQKYLRGLGNLVIGYNNRTGYANIGYASWAVIDDTEALPVGFARCNQKRFDIMKECAIKLGQDLKDKKSVSENYYYELCGMSRYNIDICL